MLLQVKGPLMCRAQLGEIGQIHLKPALTLEMVKVLIMNIQNNSYMKMLKCYSNYRQKKQFNSLFSLSEDEAMHEISQWKSKQMEGETHNITNFTGVC